MTEADSTLVLRTQNTAPTREMAQATEQFIKRRAVPLAYMLAVLGDVSETVGSSTIRDTEITIHRHRGTRRVYTDDEMARMECPYPPEPDL